MNANSYNPRRQGGAVAVFVGLFLVALVAVLLLVMDIGRLYYAQRQLENDANMAALAGARIVSGCGGSGAGTPGTLAEVTDAVTQSLTANRGTVGSFTDLGAPSTLMATGINGSPAVELGQTVLASDGKTRTFSALSAGDSRIDSVRVNLTAPQPTSFLSRFFGSSSTRLLYASATAKQPALGSFYLGTEIANVSGGALNSILGGLLCAPNDTACQNNIIGLDVGDSVKGLAGVNVSLGQLGTAVGVSSSDLSNLVSVSTTLPGVLNGLSGVLGNVGTSTSATAATLLKNLAAASTNPNAVPLGNILGSIDGIAANVPFIDLPDLILALAEDAQTAAGGGIQSIALPVNISVPGVASINTFLSVGAPPKYSGLVQAGSPAATVQTAEVTLTTRLQIPLLSSVTSTLNAILQLLGTSITLNPINLGVDVHVAPATATLDQLQCPTASMPLTAQLSANTAVATVSIGTFSGSASSNPPLAQTTSPIVSGTIKAIGGLVSTNIYVDLNNPLSTTVGTGGGNLDPVNQFRACGDPGVDPNCGVGAGTAVPSYYLALGGPNAPPSSPVDNPQTVGSSDLLSSTVSTLFGSLQSALSTGDAQNPSKLCVLLVCIPLSQLLNPLVSGIVATLTPVLVGTTGLVDTLLSPLLNALGVNVGTATVTMNTAKVDNPAIQTNCLPKAAGANGCPDAATN